MDIVVDIAEEVVVVGDTEGEVATAEMANRVQGVDVVGIEVAEMQQSCNKFSPIASNSQDGIRLFLRCTKKALLDEFSTSVSCGFKNSFLLSGLSGHFSLHSLETLLEKWVGVAHVCVSFLSHCELVSPGSRMWNKTRKLREYDRAFFLLGWVANSDSILKYEMDWDSLRFLPIFQSKWRFDTCVDVGL
jgi:hypothetical protein